MRESDLVIRFEIEERSPSLNTVHHWLRKRAWEYDKYKSRTKKVVHVRCKEQRGWKAATTKRFMRITRRSPRKLDDENLRGGCKVIVDALVEAGVLKDDSPTWVEREYRQVKGKGMLVEVFALCVDTNEVVDTRPLNFGELQKSLPIMEEDIEEGSDKQGATPS